MSPLQTSWATTSALAQAFNEEGDPITYSWTGDGDSIADPTAPRDVPVRKWATRA